MFSWFEGILLIGIIVMMGIVAIMISNSLLNSQKRGDDNLRENTAKSVAYIQSNNGHDCPLCQSNLICEHYTRNGYVAYYDDVTNTLIADKPKGYNGYSVMEVDGQTYRGASGTMVIAVICKDGTITLRWEEGK